MGWAGGSDVKSQTFSVFRNRRYKHLAEHLLYFVTRRWRGDFQASLILYFSLTVWRYFSNAHYFWHVIVAASPGNQLMNLAVWKLSISPSLPAMYSELSKPFHPSKWSHRVWQGWGFSQFPLECANVDFISGFLPKPPQGKIGIILICYLSLLPSYPSPPLTVFSLSKEADIFFSEISDHSGNSKILMCLCGGLFSRHRTDKGFLHLWPTLFRNLINLWFLTSYLILWIQMVPKVHMHFFVCACI